jgi:hypothetical protein
MLAEFMFIALVVCLLFCESAKEQFAHAMSIGTLLEMVVIENAVIWISLAIRKSQARAKLRAKLAPLALPRRYCDSPAMS